MFLFLCGVWGLNGDCFSGNGLLDGRICADKF